MNTTEIVTAILTGEVDGREDEIRAALTSRAKTLGARLMRGIALKDKVRIKQTAPIRPRYLLGMEAIVRQVNKTRLVVDFVDVEAAGRFARNCTVPAEHVELVPSEVTV